MEDIQQLQAEFMRLQRQQPNQKISERVCVEILLKLLQREKVKVYFTTDRKEYITPKQLQHEISDEVLASGGRITFGELYPILNIDESIVQSAARELVRVDHSLTLVEDNTIITDFYADQIAEEINESLQEAGQLKLSELSQRFALSVENLMNIIRLRLANGETVSRFRKVVHGVLEPPLLYTADFVARHASILRGLLSAITYPTPLYRIMQRFEFDESLFHSILSDLVRSERVKGVLQGRSETLEFIPNVFLRHRSKTISQFFNQNGYIEYSFLTRYQISQPQKYVATHFPDGFALPSCYVAKSEIVQLESSVDECIQNEEYLNAQPLLPSPFSSSDVNAVLRECPALTMSTAKPKALIMNETFVVSTGYLNKVLEMFKAKFDKWAIEDESARKEFVSLTASNQSDSLRSSTGAPVSHHDDDDDDDWDARPKGKGKGRGKQKKPAPKSKKPAQNLKNSQKSQQDALSNYYEQNVNYLLEWNPDLPDVLCREIVDELNSKLTELRDTAAKAIFKSSDSQKKFEGKSWQLEIQQLGFSIQLYHKGAASFSGDRDQIDKYLLRTLCTDLTHRIIEATASQYYVKLDDATIETVKQRNNALKKLKSLSQAHAPLTTLCDSLTKTTEDFLDRLFDVCEKIDIPLKPIDKKTEKQLFSANQVALCQQFAAERNPSNSLHIGVTLLYSLKRGSLLHIPGKMIVEVLDDMKSTLSAEEYTTISQFAERVKEYLTAKIKNKPDHEELLKNLETQLVDFKRIVDAHSKQLSEEHPVRS